MSQYSILHDVDLCVGCQACEVACKQENNVAVGTRWIRAIQVGPREVGAKLIINFVLIRCMHCTKPVCLDACPVGAITKRLDGIVLINPEICIGCAECVQVCPRGAPQLNPKTNIFEMCTMCVHRVDKGLEPVCVRACPYEAIRFGETNQLIELKRERFASSIA